MPDLNFGENKLVKINISNKDQKSISPARQLHQNLKSSVRKNQEESEVIDKQLDKHFENLLQDESNHSTKQILHSTSKLISKSKKLSREQKKYLLKTLYDFEYNHHISGLHLEKKNVRVLKSLLKRVTQGSKFTQALASNERAFTKGNVKLISPLLRTLNDLSGTSSLHKEAYVDATKNINQIMKSLNKSDNQLYNSFIKHNHLVLSAGCQTHVMIYELNNLPRGLLSFKIYNTGLGISNNHKTRKDVLNNSFMPKFETMKEYIIKKENFQLKDFEKLMITSHLYDSRPVAVRLQLRNIYIWGESRNESKFAEYKTQAKVQSQQKIQNCWLKATFAYLKNNMSDEAYYTLRKELFLSQSQKAYTHNRLRLGATLEAKAERALKRAQISKLLDEYFEKNNDSNNLKKASNTATVVDGKSIEEIRETLEEIKKSKYPILAARQLGSQKLKICMLVNSEMMQISINITPDNSNYPFSVNVKDGSNYGRRFEAKKLDSLVTKLSEHYSNSLNQDIKN